MNDKSQKSAKNPEIVLITADMRKEIHYLLEFDVQF